MALALLWLTYAIAFPEIVLQGRIFVTPDFEAPSAFAAAGRAAMASGEYPLWNPYLFLGMPSFGSLAFVPYIYPPTEILTAFAKLPFWPPLGWLVFYAIGAGYGVFLLLRHLRCEFWPSLLGGVAFMLMPHLVSMGVFGHGSKLASTAYLPYLALLVLRLREPGRRALGSGLLALAVGLLLLRGHPQIAFYGFLMLGLLTVFEIVAAWRSGMPRADIGRFAAGVAGGTLVGFGLAAVMLLPVKSYAAESIRGASEGGGVAYQYATNWSFSLGELATLFLPSAAGFGEGTYVGTMPFTNFPMYIGVASLLLGVAAVVLLRGRGVWFWIALGALALFVSFGRNFPLVYDLFYRFLPYFNKFRVPVMILVLQQLAACVLLGLGLAALWGLLPRDAAWRHPPRATDARRLLFAAVAAAVFLLVIVQPWSGALAERVVAKGHLPPEARSTYAEVARRLLQHDGLRIALLLVAHAGVIWLAVRRQLPRDVAGLALVALVAVDLGAVDRKMVVPERTWPGVAARTAPEPPATAPPGGLVRFLQAQPKDGAAPLRILPLGRLYMENEWMRWGIASTAGYHPAKLARFEALVETQRQSLDPQLLDLFGVRWIVLPEPSERSEAEPAYAGPDGAAYPNPRAMPRAWVTGVWEPVADAASCKTRLLDPVFPRRRAVLLERTPEPAPDSTASGSAQVAAFSANRVTVDVDATAPALVVLAEAWHPNWRARVNGDERPVLVADCVLRAVVVPAGRSQVELRFVDPALQRGLRITLGSLAIVLALIGWDVWRGRRARHALVEARA